MLTTVLPFAPPGSETDADIFEEKTPGEREADILAREFPRLCNDAAVMVQRPFRLLFDPTQETACTDCKAEIRLAPWPFLEGRRDIGFASNIHECGHIRHSPWAPELLARAIREGDEALHTIVSLVLDRKDDLFTVEEAPGFADLLRTRLAYICTMTRRADLKLRFPQMTDTELDALLHTWKPKDVLEDFFWATKWHKRPRFKATHRVMKYLTRSRLMKMGQEEFWWSCNRVREILGEALQKDKAFAEATERRFRTLFLICLGVEMGVGKKLSPKAIQALVAFVYIYVASVRKSELDRLVAMLGGRGNDPGIGFAHPGPISVGVEPEVPVVPRPPAPEHAAAYGALRAAVEPLVNPLIERLRRIDNPSEFILHGQDEGELDFTAIARIACGLPGIYHEIVLERDIDAEIHLALDTSGSMAGEKGVVIKKVTTVFSEAMMAMHPSVVGNLWSYDSTEIVDYGEPSLQSAFVGLDGRGGNSDTHMLKAVGDRLGRSNKRRKILLVLTDQGPDDLVEARRLAEQLLARGIIVVHLLTDAHGTPNIYPIELLYESLETCLAEIGEVLETVIKHLR